jgi:hypothetical protein
MHIASIGIDLGKTRGQVLLGIFHDCGELLAEMYGFSRKRDAAFQQERACAGCSSACGRPTSRPSPTRSSVSARRMRFAGVYARFPASVLWSRPQL